MLNWLWNAFSRRSESPAVKLPSNVEQSQDDDDGSSANDRSNIEDNAQNDNNDLGPLHDTNTNNNVNKALTQDAPIAKNDLSRSRYTDLQEEALFYCPYRDCSYTASLAATTCQHIRRKHDPNFYILLSNNDALSAVFTTTTSDQSISLLDADMSIEPTERLIAVNIKDVDGDKKHMHYFCPYQKCSHRTDHQHDITQHIRSKHYPDLIENGDAEHQFYRTVDGKVIIDFSEKYHSVLLPSIALIPCDASGNVPKQYANNAIVNDPNTAASSNTAQNANKSAAIPTARKVTSSKRQETPEPLARRSNPKRRKRNPLKEEEWILY